MTSRPLIIALAVLVGLNVFLLGGLAGGAVLLARRAQTAPPVAAAAAAARQPLARAALGLTPARREAFRQALRQARLDSADQVAQGVSARTSLAGLMAAPQLDRPAIDAALSQVRSADLAQRQRVETAVVDFAAVLTPQERQGFVRHLGAAASFRQAAVKTAGKVNPRQPQKAAAASTERP